MSDSFLNGFIKKSLPKQYTAQSPYGETIPSNDCNNGFFPLVNMVDTE